MTEKKVIRLEALFLHDTQMANLASEQQTLRAAFHRISADSPLPFSPLLPFCPIANTDSVVSAVSAADSSSRISAIPSRLTIGAPVGRDGWIIRPLIDPVPSAQTGSASALPSLPGYPPFPAEPGFILGYAGDHCDRLLAESFLPEPFSVSARYRSTLTVTVEIAGNHGKPDAYSASYAIGAARWEKGEN